MNHVTCCVYSGDPAWLEWAAGAIFSAVLGFTFAVIVYFHKKDARANLLITEYTQARTAFLWWTRVYEQGGLVDTRATVETMFMCARHAWSLLHKAQRVLPELAPDDYFISQSLWVHGKASLFGIR